MRVASVISGCLILSCLAACNVVPTTTQRAEINLPPNTSGIGSQPQSQVYVVRADRRGRIECAGNSDAMISVVCEAGESGNANGSDGRCPSNNNRRQGIGVCVRDN